jgi:hypothetical protein
MVEKISNIDSRVEASFFMKNDYPNEYTHLFHLLLNAGKDNPIILSQQVHIPRSFTARYTGQLDITTTPAEEQKIEALDRLSVEVGRLISAVPIDKGALLEKIIEVWEICDRQDYKDELGKVFGK